MSRRQQKQRTIPDIFAIYGEPSFRDGEERVISRLLRAGPLVLATGGGAYLREFTRMRIAELAVSVWLKADLDVLMRRVRKRGNRPLLQTEDPEATMRDLMAVRHPVYAAADVMVISREVVPRPRRPGRAGGARRPSQRRDARPRRRPVGFERARP